MSRFARRREAAATAKHGAYYFRPFSSEVISNPCPTLCAAGTGYVSDLENLLQNAPEHFGGLPNHDIHVTPPLCPQRRQQAQPHPISKTATRNISTPTGNTMEIKIPAPKAAAKRPSRRMPPFPPPQLPDPQFPGPQLPKHRFPQAIAVRLLPYVPLYTPGPSMVKKRRPGDRGGVSHFFSCQSRRGFSSS